MEGALDHSHALDYARQTWKPIKLARKSLVMEQPCPWSSQGDRGRTAVVRNSRKADNDETKGWVRQNREGGEPAATQPIRHKGNLGTEHTHKQFEFSPCVKT